MTEANKLYFGDCLEVMRAELPSESVDLIYLDPPFNSKRLYNAFIGNAQWVAFNDTWRWHEAVGDFHEVVSQPGPLMETPVVQIYTVEDYFEGRRPRMPVTSR